MFRSHAETQPRRSGFTLIELLVVITIIAVLAALLLPGCSVSGDPEGNANRLFVEAAILIRSGRETLATAQNKTSREAIAAIGKGSETVGLDFVDAAALKALFDVSPNQALEVSSKYSQGLVRLQQIIDEYPESTMAVKLVQDETIFDDLTLKHIRKEATILSNYAVLVQRFLDADKRKNDFIASSDNSVYTLRGCGAITLTPDGRFLVIVDEQKRNRVRLHRVHDGQAQRQLVVTNLEIECVAVAPDGKKMAVGTANGQLGVCDLPKGPVELSKDVIGDCITSVVFDRTSNAVVAVTSGGLIANWDVRTGRLVWRNLANFGMPTKVVSLHKEVMFAVVGNAKGIHLWSLSGVSRKVLGGGLGNLSDIASRPGTPQIAIASKGHRVMVWNVESGRVIREYGGDDPGCVAYSRKGRYLAYAQKDRVLIVHDVQTDKLVARLVGHFHNIVGAAFCSDGLHLVSRDVLHNVKVWSLPLQQ
jgi:prepilin-type N-terminal cleavage/methylation domain-containing protein